MKRLGLRSTLATGVAIVAVTNAVVLVGAAYNRSGEPEAVLKITQREARTPREYGFERENSGVRMDLQYRALGVQPPKGRATIYNISGYGGPHWLDSKKLAELGFDLTVRGHQPSDIRRYSKQLPKPALLVLELDGDAYRESLKRVEAFAASDGKLESGRAARQEREENTRLFVVDAGLDAAQLRRKYPDRARFAIVNGKVWLRDWGEETSGYVQVLGSSVNVPLEFHGVIGVAPRFETTVSFGRRLEPWLTGATARP